MAFPWQRMTAVGLVFAYVLTSYSPNSWPKLSFFVNFALLWTAQLLIYAVWSVILYPKVFSPLIRLPGPAKNESFINGQFPRISREPSGRPMMDWINSIPNDGLIRYLGLLNREKLLVTSPKALAEVLTTKSYHFQKPSGFRYGIGRILGIGVLLAEGDEHKTQRRNLMPAFAFRHVKDLYPVFWGKSREGVQAMTQEVLRDAAKEPVYLDNASDHTAKDTAVMEVGGWASRVTLDIIGVAGLGRDFGAIKDPDNELIGTYQKLFRPSRQAQMLGLLQQFIPGWLTMLLPVKRNEDINEAAGLIRAVCADLIRTKKEKMAHKERSDVDILSVALESGGFTDENLVDQLMTFLAAGHETTATAMTWAVYMLCLNPDVQTRLRAEIRSRLPAIGDETAESVSSADIDRMPYLNAVCSEVLRYYSPVPLTMRETACDTTILGQHIPKGTQVILSPWAVNKSKALWGPDALKFDPDRWMAKFDGDKSAASGGAPSNYAFMTFLHGPRSCIGMGFAKAEFACLLAAWIGRFEFELKNKEELDENNIVIKGGVTARPAKGLYVKARVVDGW